jgi:hypothetical protein
MLERQATGNPHRQKIIGDGDADSGLQPDTFANPDGEKSSVADCYGRRVDRQAPGRKDALLDKVKSLCKCLHTLSDHAKGPPVPEHATLVMIHAAVTIAAFAANIRSAARAREGPEQKAQSLS